MKKILYSIMALAMLFGAVGAGTMAYFNDTETSSNNTFAAGNLNMVLSGGTQNGESVTGTWVSPANWAPGQSVPATIHFTNIGSINANHIYFTFTDRPHSGGPDGSNLMDAIIVEELTERFNAVTTANQAATVAAQVGNHDAILTLRELVDFRFGVDAYYTVDDRSGDLVVLAGGNLNDYDFSMKLTLVSTAGNEYQGDTAGFSLSVRATQNSPTDGMVKLHD